MSELTLVIANMNYSSWSIRPYFILKHCGIPFRKTVVPLFQPDTPATLLAHSPAGKAPVLKDGATVVWESLAICEYLAERFPDRGLLPADAATRAHVRSISNEMHAGFGPMREVLAMNCQVRINRPSLAADIRDDITRIVEIWCDCRRRYGKAGDDGFLFGRFTIADAMYVPVVSRLITYSIELDGAAEAYRETIRNLPAYRAWEADAAAEPCRIPQYDR